MEDAAKKLARSPQFPFIPLERAIARAREFEAVYTHNAGRVGHAVKVWGYAEKSSGGIQTIAALVAFGLMRDEGSNEARKLFLTPLAMTILKDKRPGAAELAIKLAALKPKVLADLWNEWGTKRPPDVECISTLHLDKKFTEEASERLLRIYDRTIAFAKLADSDSETDNEGVGQEVVIDGEGDSKPLSTLKPPPPIIPGKVALMANERVVFAHEIRPNQGFRVVVTGEVDQDMVKALKAFAEFQAMLVANTPKTSSDPEL